MTAINLLKPKTNSIKNGKERRFSLILLTVFASALATLVGWYFILQSEIEEAKIVESVLREEDLELGRLEALLIKNQEHLRQLDQTHSFLESIRRDRSAPLEVFDTVSDSLPEALSIRLTRMSLSERNLRLSGTSKNPEATASFLSKLRSSALFKFVELNSWQRDRKTFRFEVLGQLKE